MRPAPELRAPKVICHNPRGVRGTQQTDCGDLVVRAGGICRAKNREKPQDFVQIKCETKYVISAESWFLGSQT